MVVDPEVTPVTSPVVDTTVAADVLLLTQVPPVKPGAVSCIVAPAHTAVGPEIVGTALTATVALPVIIRVQPVDALVAITVYTPAVVIKPKSIGPPVPAITGGMGLPPTTGW